MTTLNRAQIEAWLTLEGYAPYTQEFYWVVENKAREHTLNHTDENDWSNQTYTAGCNDKPVEWRDLSDMALISLYEALTRDCSNSEEL